MQNTTFNKILFAKALLFITMVQRKLIRLDNMNWAFHNVHDFEECRIERQEQMVLVQHYGIVQSAELPAYNPDAKINRIRIKWERHGVNLRVKKRRGICIVSNGNCEGACPCRSCQYHA